MASSKLQGFHHGLEQVTLFASAMAMGCLKAAQRLPIGCHARHKLARLAVPQ